MNVSSRLWCAAVLIALGACASSRETPPDDDAPDAYVPPAPDGGSDAGVDGGAHDGGEDLPDSGEGAPDADVDGGEPPCTPGEIRAVDCGFCGTLGQECSAEGLWVDTSECLGDGVCEPGTVEDRTTELCAEEQRVCQSTCQWTEWEETVASTGECAVGEEREAEDSTCHAGVPKRRQRCTDTCEWEFYGDCADECGGYRRTTPAESEEICIPAGNFIRGDDAIRNAIPVRTVYVSEYYIDRYPVTNDRYRACVDDGDCTKPISLGLTSFDDTTRGDYPVQRITWEQAEDFCLWDDRRLPTEAEWEKAARGPAPDDRTWPWGDDLDCDILLTSDCDGFSYSATDAHTEEFDDLPDTASPYGVEMLVGGAIEWVSDWYDRYYYDEDDSLSDPEGPSTGSYKILRGYPRQIVHTRISLSVRTPNYPTMSANHSGVRCARTP